MTPSLFLCKIVISAIHLWTKRNSKLIVRNLESLVECLKSEVYSDVEAYQTKQENFDDPANYYITDYDEVFNDDDGYPD